MTISSERGIRCLVNSFDLVRCTIPMCRFARRLCAAGYSVGGTKTEPTELPTRMNPGCLKGAWLRRSELAEWKEVYDSSLGHIVSKPLWLAPVLEPQLVTVERVCTTLKSHFEEADQPRMISMRDVDGSELQRVFVVSDNWPTADKSK